MGADPGVGQGFRVAATLGTLKFLNAYSTGRGGGEGLQESPRSIVPGAREPSGYRGPQVQSGSDVGEVGARVSATGTYVNKVLRACARARVPTHRTKRKGLHSWNRQTSVTTRFSLNQTEAGCSLTFAFCSSRWDTTRKHHTCLIFVTPGSMQSVVDAVS